MIKNSYNTLLICMSIRKKKQMLCFQAYLAEKIALKSTVSIESSKTTG